MNDQTKHPFIAFLLSVFPGGGQFYYGNIFRGMFYFFATVLPVILTIFLTMVTYADIFVLISLIGVFFYIVSFFDIILTSMRRKKLIAEGVEGTDPTTKSIESERFFTIVLSFIPGLGHFQLGLMQRGLTFLTAFIGAGIMIFFVAVFVRQDVFLVFMAFLPILWIYSFFDAVQQLNRKQAGEELEDRSILEDFEKHNENGQKSKTLATLLSIFPGVGLMYLGYQQRGIQLLAGFLISIYVLDVLRLSLFFFIIPIIWFYSFFDGLQKSSQYGTTEVVDKPIIKNLLSHKRWIGIGSIVLGIFFILDRVLIPSLAPRLANIFQIDFGGWYYEYFHITVISLLFIAGGIKLLMGSKKKEVEEL